MQYQPAPGYPPHCTQYGGYSVPGYECQQPPYRTQVETEDLRKRGFEEVNSPTHIINDQSLDKRSRATSPTVFYNMDTQALQPQQLPAENNILNAINSLRMDVSKTVTSNDIKSLATKEDVKLVHDRLEMYSKEVSNLKEMFEAQKKEIQSVAELANKNAALLIDMGQRINKPEVGVSQLLGQDGGSQRQNQNNMSKRMNLIIEGVRVDTDFHLYILKLAETIGIVLYRCDITQVTRLRRRDTTVNKPGPLLVSFEHPHVRDAFLRNKHKLLGNAIYNQVWVNADEPFEVRRLKSRFRRIAYLAKQKDIPVYYNSDIIRIGENTYNASQLSQIPPEFQPKEDDRVGERRAQNQRIAPPQNEDDKQDEPDTDSRDKSAIKFQFVTDKTAQDMDTSNDQPQPVPPTVVDKPAGAANNLDIVQKLKYDQTQGGHVKIRFTKYGLCFSGTTAYISNMYKRIFYDDDGVKCYSVEQRYSFLQAMFNKLLDLAHALMNPELDGYRIKEMCKDIPKNPDWDKVKVPTIRRLMIKKFLQNKDLYDALMETAPHRLVEASWDLLWGGGQPFESEAYDNGTFEGVNQFGDMVTEWRDVQLSLR